MDGWYSGTNLLKLYIYPMLLLAVRPSVLPLLKKQFLTSLFLPNKGGHVYFLGAQRTALFPFSFFLAHMA